MVGANIFLLAKRYLHPACQGTKAGSALEPASSIVRILPQYEGELSFTPKLNLTLE
jgi:hypothetical protein